MTDVPDDIMRAASEAWRGCWTLNLDETITGAEAIARAIAAERERCAKVAEYEATRNAIRPLDAICGGAMAHKIAAAIRKGDKP